MGEVVRKAVEEIDYYKGEHAIPGIRFRSAGRELGVRAWGMNVIEIEAGCEKYPEHDHVKDGQEEVYVVLRGSGTLNASTGPVALEAGVLVHVPADVKRKIVPGADGIAVLAIGGAPGKAYEPQF